MVLRRLDTKKETSPQGNSHIVSKPSPERVMKSCLKCLKLEAPEIAEKKKRCLVCQVTPSSSQICKEVQKPYCGRDDYLFWMSAQYFFSCLN